MYNVKLNMVDTKTGDEVIRNIDMTNACNSDANGHYIPSKEDQRKNLEQWIKERGNKQHETELKLISWEL